MTDRELDIWIAEKVFDRKVCIIGSTTRYPVFSDGDDWPIPEYSTDISDAWLVAEKLRLAVEPSYQDGLWYAYRTGHKILGVADSSAAKAICLAAKYYIENIENGLRLNG